MQGEPLAWREACPLNGRCPECALDFAWGDLLSGRLHYPRWSTEGASGAGSWLARVPLQLIMATCRPRRMLRELRLEHEIRPGRLAGGLALPFILMAAVLVLITARGYVQNGVPWARSLTIVLSSNPAKPVQVTLPIPAAGEGRVATDGTFGFMIVPRDPAWGPMPTVTVDAPDGAGALMLTAPRIEVLAAGGRPVMISPAMGPMIREAEDGSGPEEVYVYLQPVITAARQLTGITTIHPAPLDVFGYVFDDHAAFLFTVVLPLGLAIPVSVGGFVLLPIARRRARVRWAHLLRLTCLAAWGGLGLGAAALILGPLTGILGPGFPGFLDAAIDGAGRAMGISQDDQGFLLGIFGSFVVPIVLAATWWTWAARHYLRMQRPVLVGAAVATVSWLGLVVLLGVGVAFVITVLDA